MKLHESQPAPNSRRVHMFMDEKDIELSRVDVDIRAGENLTPEFLAKNPMGRIPVLELDDGSYLSESVAICRYLEALYPSPPLFGNAPESMAHVEMWNRRAELNFLMNVAMAFRNITGFFEDREKISKEWGEISAEAAARALPVFDAQLANNEFLAGDRFSIADITLVVALDFARNAKIDLPTELPNIQRWYDQISARPSFKAR